MSELAESECKSSEGELASSSEEEAALDRLRFFPALFLLLDCDWQLTAAAEVGALRAIWLEFGGKEGMAGA